MAQDQPHERAEHRDRHGQEHGERQRPALVERGENQEDEDQRQPEDGPGRARGLLFLVRQVGPVVADLVRQRRARHVLQRGDRLPGTVAGRRRAVHLHGAKDVEPVRELRAERPFRGLDRRERHHRAGVVPDVELSDLLRRDAVFAFRLHEDPPLPSEPVELVHEQPAEKRLHRLIDIADRHALPQHLVPIDTGEDLRLVGGERRRDPGELGTLARFGQEFLELGVEKVDRAAAPVLQPEGKAPLAAEARNRGRHDRERRGFRRGRFQLAVQPVHERPRLERRATPLLPGFQLHEVERVVARGHARDQAEPDDRVEVGHAVGLREQGVHLAGDRVGPFERRGRRQLDVQQKVAVVLLREKARGQPVAEEARGQREQHECGDADERLSNQPVTQADVPVRGSLQPAVEPGEHPPEPAARLLARTEQQGRQRRRQRQRVEGGDDDRHRNRDGELLIEPSLNPAHHANRNEDRGEDQRDADDRPGHLLHRFQGRVFWAHPFFDVVFHRLHHDDRIVDDEADREDEAEERQRVDRETEQREHREGANQRHRYGQHRDERRAPVLEEEKYDEDDEHQGFREGLHDVLDAFGHRQRGIERVGVVEIGREPGVEVVHHAPYALRHRQRVRTG